MKQGTLTRSVPPPRHNALMFAVKYICIYRCVYVHTCEYMHIIIYVYLYVYGCTCVNVCLYMCILFYILSDCVGLMDYEILTADGDLILLVYIMDINISWDLVYHFDIVWRYYSQFIYRKILC